jgi:hypothetical protein
MPPGAAARKAPNLPHHHQQHHGTSSPTSGFGKMAVRHRSAVESGRMAPMKRRSPPPCGGRRMAARRKKEMTRLVIKFSSHEAGGGANWEQPRTWILLAAVTGVSPGGVAMAGAWWEDSLGLRDAGE